MAIFAYHARDLQGADHTGTIETSDESQVARLLGKKGLIVISIKSKAQTNQNFLNKFFNRVPFSDVVVSTRQLATMIESGLILSEALDVLIEQQTNKRYKAVLEEVSRDVKVGLDLASALKKHPDVFPPIYASLVKSGEQSGKLDIVLTQMADSLEKDRAFRSKVRGAMIYPIIVVTMMVGVVFVMMIFVIPKLTSLYTQSSIELPMPTKILITVSEFFQKFWYIVIMGMVGAFLGFKKWVSTSSGKQQYDKIIIKTPVVGKIVETTTLTNFTRTFGLLITAGIPLLDAISIVSDVVGNSVYKKALQSTYLGVERGLSFSAQLEAVGAFPALISQMYKVGEETGKVDKVSFKMAEYYESEADDLLKNLTVAIEPIVLVLLGIGVAFLVLSIILPIYKLTSSIS